MGVSSIWHGHVRSSGRRRAVGVERLPPVRQQLVDRRSNLRLAGSHATLGDTLRATYGHPFSVPEVRLRANLLELSS